MDPVGKLPETTGDPMAQQGARNYGMSLSNEVNMTNCYKHCKHFFDKHESIHFNVLIAYWMMAGYLGPIDSIEEAYRKGHEILLDLTYGEGRMLKLSDQNLNMIEYRASTVPEPLVCFRHRGSCFLEKPGFGDFVDFVDLAGLEDFVVLADGMIKSVPKVNEAQNLISDGSTTSEQPKMSVLLIDGNNLSSREVFHPPRKLRYLAYLKPRPKSLNSLLNNVKKPLSVLLLRDCELLQEIDIPLHKFKNLTVLEISGLSHVPFIKPSDFDPPKHGPILQMISELSELRSLHLSDFLTKELPPNFFAKLTKLRWVIFRGCSKLVSLPSVKPLRDLKMLDVSHCSALQKLGSGFIHCPELQMLDFSYTSITNIPTIKSRNLTHVIARGVKVALLSGFREVSSLEVLDLSGTIVRDIRRIVCNTELTILDVSRTLIESIYILPHLVHLRGIILQECTRLTKLSPVGNLTKLEVFDISGCKSIEKLPEGLSDLISLKALNLSLTSISRLPSFVKLTGLLKLSLRGLKLVSLEGLEYLNKLEILDLNSLQIIHPQELKFEFLQNLANLQILDLSETPVVQLKHLSELVNLKELLLANCQLLKAVPDLQLLTNLETLDLSLLDSSTSSNAQGETESEVPSSCRKLVLKNRYGVKRFFPLTSHGELEYLDLRGTDVDRIPFEHMAQVNIVWLLAMIGLSGVSLSRMGAMAEAIDWKDENPGCLQGDFSDASEIQIVSTVGNKSSILVEGNQFFRVRKGANQDSWEVIIHQFSVSLPPKGDRDGTIYLDGDEFILRDDLSWARILLNHELAGKSVEIHGFSEVPNDFQNLLQNTEADNVALVGNDFLVSLSDICSQPMKVCCIRRCQKMMSLLSGNETNAKFPETLVLSDLFNLNVIYDKDVPLKSIQCLQHLYIDCCPNLTKVIIASPVPENLKTLSIKCCNRLKTFMPNVPVVNLVKLTLFELPKLKSIEVELPNLESLSIGQCPKLENLDGIITSASESLTYVCLDSCLSLTHALPSYPDLRKIEELKISCCNEISTLFVNSASSISSPSSPKLQNLKNLRLHNLSELKSISALGNLRKLEVFDLSGCISLRYLPEDLSEMTSLKELNLYSTSFSQLPSFAKLTSLLKLSLRGMKVVSLEGLETLSNLEILDLKGLQIVPPKEWRFDFIQYLVNLQILDLSQTPVAQLPGLSNLTKLRKLILGNCQHLEPVPDLQRLTNLEVLDLSLLDRTTVNNFQAEADIVDQTSSHLTFPSSLQWLSVKNRSGLQNLLPLTSLGEPDHLHLGGTDIVDQVKSIQSAIGTGPRMGNLSEVRNQYDNPQELYPVRNTNPYSGFDRFKKVSESLGEVITFIQQKFSESSCLAHVANIQSKALEKRFRSIPSDLSFIQENIDSLNSPGNCKSSEELLHGLVETATDISDDDYQLDYTNLTELLRVVVKLKLLIHRNQADGSKEEEEEEEEEEAKNRVLEEKVEDVLEEEETYEKRGPKMTDDMTNVIDPYEIRKIFETLSSSYSKLTVTQKKCLLCFSVFRCSEFRDKSTGAIKLKSLVIKKSILIHWWYGEQFVDENNADGVDSSETIERIGYQILEVLQDNGFLEPVMMKRRESGWCCMRAYVHSFVIARAKEARFFDFSRKHGKLTPHFTHSNRACLLTSQRNFSSSYTHWANYTNFPAKLESFGRVSTLFNVNESLIDIDVEWFARMKELSVLHLRSCHSGVEDLVKVVNWKFLKQLNEMKKLRLLNLQGLSSIKRLSDSVSHLTNLRLLDLRECSHLKELPKDIGSLKNLTHLDITHCRLLSDLPSGIKLLSKLEVFKGFRITGARLKKGTCKLEDLLNLGRLRILSVFVDKEEAPRNHEHVQVLKKMQNLHYLKITWESVLMIDDGNQIGQEDQDTTPVAVPVPKRCLWLKKNCWERQLSQHNSSWMSNNLRKLVLHGLPDRIASDLLAPAELENLEELHIIAGNVRILHGGTSDSDKWNVKTLRMKYLNNLSINWFEFRRMFPHLTYLEMLKCKKFAFFPCDDEGVWTIPS